MDCSDVNAPGAQWMLACFITLTCCWWWQDLIQPNHNKLPYGSKQ